jgi:putative aminopeptidase FrvX
MLPEPDPDAALGFLTALLEAPSPTGYHREALRVVRQAFSALDLPGAAWSETRKGALALTWPGLSDRSPRAISVHVDTLGAMVRELKSNGRLMLTQLGGYAWSAVEGENVTVHALSSGVRFRGTIQTINPSVHTGDDVRDGKREEERMEVRLDARVSSAAETGELGIDVGDLVFFDPRVEVTDTGFIKSRFLDDKAGVAALYGAVYALGGAHLTPAQRTTFFFSNYEEVGHGAAVGIPSDTHELVVVDMAASTTGEHQHSDEYSVGICAKDSGGPYDLDLRQRLVALARGHGIPYRVDTYPRYGSDAGAYLRAGGDVRVALVGPGVDASHGYERTHRSSLEATIRLIAAYLVSD